MKRPCLRLLSDVFARCVGSVGLETAFHGRKTTSSSLHHYDHHQPTKHHRSSGLRNDPSSPPPHQTLSSLLRTTSPARLTRRRQQHQATRRAPQPRKTTNTLPPVSAGPTSSSLGCSSSRKGVNFPQKKKTGGHATRVFERLPHSAPTQQSRTKTIPVGLTSVGLIDSALKETS